MTATHKKCSKCGTLKPIGEFHTDRNAASGHRSACKECWRAQVAIYGRTARADPIRHARIRENFKRCLMRKAAAK